MFEIYCLMRTGVPRDNWVEVMRAGVLGLGVRVHKDGRFRVDVGGDSGGISHVLR